MLLRLAYLTVANTFAVLLLLPVSDREKDAELLLLRHQIAVLERQLGGKKVRFTPPDRALLLALLHHLRPETLRQMRLLVRPDMVCAGTATDLAAVHGSVHACVTHQLGLDEQLIAQFRRPLQRS